MGTQEIYHAHLKAAGGRRPHDEMEAQRAWSRLPPGAELRAVQGAERVEVRSPGVWNRGQGPDFKDAVLLVDGVACRGDVEIHMRESDWDAHGHSGDPRYDGVVLHAVVHPGGPGACGPAIVVAAPEQACPDTEPGRPGRPGACGLLLATMDDNALKSFFESEGARRFFAKSDHFAALAMARGAGQAFLSGLFAACGYKRNKENFLLLYERVAQRLDSPGIDIDALLWGESGLLPDTVLSSLPEAQSAFATQMWRRWWPLREEGRTPIPWHKSGVRPANTPSRRVAALAALLRGCGPRIYEDIAKAFLAATSSPDLPPPWRTLRPLLSASDPLWDGFADFGTPLASRAAVLGASRALDIAANAFLPCLHADLSLQGRPEDARLCLAAWKRLPPSEPNTVLEAAACRWMIPFERGRKIFRGLAAAQGCLAAYARLCQPSGGDCEACARDAGGRPAVFAAAVDTAAQR